MTWLLLDGLKRWDHRGDFDTLSCRFVCKEAYLRFIRCLDEVDYERRLVELLVWVLDQEESLADKPNLVYLVVLLQFDGLWFVDYHEY